MLDSNRYDKTDCNTEHVGSNGNNYRQTKDWVREQCCQASNGIKLPHAMAQEIAPVSILATPTTTSAIWRPDLGCWNRQSGLLAGSLHLRSGLA